MAKSRLIARQSARPSGLLGQIVARVMAVKTARVNRLMLKTVDPKPGNQIVEIGCGYGRALRIVAGRIREGRVLGIDPSPVMCEIATRHNRAAISAGRVSVERSAVTARKTEVSIEVPINGRSAWNASTASCFADSSGSPSSDGRQPGFAWPAAGRIRHGLDASRARVLPSFSAIKRT